MIIFKPPVVCCIIIMLMYPIENGNSNEIFCRVLDYFNEQYDLKITD